MLGINLYTTSTNINFFVFLRNSLQGFVIAFVSEFIPRLYFKWSKGKDGSLEGYLDTSLSCYDTRDYPNNQEPNINLSSNQYGFESNGCGLGLPSCR
jgi:hypothetical protein